MQRQLISWWIAFGMVVSLLGGMPVLPSAIAVSPSSTETTSHCAMSSAMVLTAVAPSGSCCCCSGPIGDDGGDTVDTASVSFLSPSSLVESSSSGSCGCAMQSAPPALPDATPIIPLRFADAAIAPVTLPLTVFPVLHRVVSPNIGFLAPPLSGRIHAADVGRAPPFSFCR
jgi:hypothetical protein